MSDFDRLAGKNEMASELKTLQKFIVIGDSIIKCKRNVNSGFGLGLTHTSLYKLSKRNMQILEQA